MVSSSKRRLAPGFGARAGEEEDVEAWRSPSAVARRAGGWKRRGARGTDATPPL